MVQLLIVNAVPPIQGAISDAKNTRVSYFLVVPCFLYIALWALWVWNADGRPMSVKGSDVEREIEAAAGGAIPPAHVGLNYTGGTEYYESGDKQEMENVEKV